MSGRGKFWTKPWTLLAGCSGQRDGACKAAHCWAASLVGARLAHNPRFAGLTDEAHRWTGAVRFFPEALEKPLRWRKPRVVAPGWLGDLFDPGIVNEQVAAVYGVMAACPQHRFLITTKRTERRREWFEWVMRREEQGRSMFPHDDAGWRIRQLFASCAAKQGDSLPPHHGGPWPLPNVWEGVSVCDQADADVRIPVLLDTPATHRWIIAEPLLGPVDLTDYLEAGRETGGPQGWQPDSAVDWVVVGAETGHNARPCDPEWLRGIVRQCREAGVPAWTKAGLAEGDPCYQRRLPWAT